MTTGQMARSLVARASPESSTSTTARLHELRRCLSGQDGGDHRGNDSAALERAQDAMARPCPRKVAPGEPSELSRRKRVRPGTEHELHVPGRFPRKRHRSGRLRRPGAEYHRAVDRDLEVRRAPVSYTHL